MSDIQQIAKALDRHQFTPNSAARLEDPTNDDFGTCSCGSWWGVRSVHTQHQAESIPRHLRAGPNRRSIPPRELQAFREWLKRPNGSFLGARDSGLTADAVMGGGIDITTYPFRSNPDDL